jgi:hypothetical protein
METQVRRRAGAVQWTHAVPGGEAAAGGQPDIAPQPTATPAAAAVTAEYDDDAPLRELVGATFSSAKELRHLAEREMGELFVPVELLAESEHVAVFTLHPGSLAPLLVHAERARHWFPFRITRVEPVRVHVSATRPRLPHLNGAPKAPVDWL